MNPAPAISNSSNSNNWFVCPQANPKAETRLFLFPYAGGGPAVFGKWPAELPDNVETWIAHYPGRGSRYKEPPINRLNLLVEGLIQAIQPLLNKPIVFFGHSLGGLVGFELAQHLRRKSLPQPELLFISACGAPHLPDPHPPIHSLPDAEFLQSLKQLNGIPSELLRQPEAMQLLLPTLRADFEAIESYQHSPNESPLHCPIIAFGGLADPRVSRKHLEGWAAHTNSHFSSQYFSGDHFFINASKEAVIAAIGARVTTSYAKR